MAGANSAKAAGDRRSAAAAQPKPTHRLWLLRLFGLLFALYILEQDVEVLLALTNSQPGRGTIGIARPAQALEFGEGFVVVDTVVPGGPLDEAGVIKGDHLRFDRTYDYFRPHTVGEVIGFTHDHLGQRVHKSIIVAPIRGSSPESRVIPIALVLGLGNILTVLFGALMMWRGQSRAAQVLGVAVAGFGWMTAGPQFWESSPVAFLAFDILGGFGRSMWLLSIPAFAMCLYEETVGPIKTRDRRMLWLLGAFILIVMAVTNYIGLTNARLPILGDIRPIGLPILPISFAMCLFYIILG